jgi:hypothetical protein
MLQSNLQSIVLAICKASSNDANFDFNALLDKIHFNLKSGFCHILYDVKHQMQHEVHPPSFIFLMDYYCVGWLFSIELLININNVLETTPSDAHSVLSIRSQIES